MFFALCIIASAFSVTINGRPSKLEVALVVAAVAIFGIPHSALDPWVGKLKGHWSDKTSLLKFLLIYITFALATISLWTISPVAGLTIFLVMSVWHFSKDWEGELLLPTRILAAASIFFVPMISGWDTFDFIGYAAERKDVESIFHHLTGIGVSLHPFLERSSFLQQPASLFMKSPRAAPPPSKSLEF